MSLDVYLEMPVVDELTAAEIAALRKMHNAANAAEARLKALSVTMNGGNREDLESLAFAQQKRIGLREVFEANVIAHAGALLASAEEAARLREEVVRLKAEHTEPCETPKACRRCSVLRQSHNEARAHRRICDCRPCRARGRIELTAIAAENAALRAEVARLKGTMGQAYATLCCGLVWACEYPCAATSPEALERASTAACEAMNSHHGIVAELRAEVTRLRGLVEAVSSASIEWDSRRAEYEKAEATVAGVSTLLVVRVDEARSDLRAAVRACREEVGKR